MSDQIFHFVSSYIRFPMEVRGISGMRVDLVVVFWRKVDWRLQQGLLGKSMVKRKRKEGIINNTNTFGS